MSAAAVVMSGAAVAPSASTVVLDLDRVNALDRDAFVATLGGAFEHSAWVAEAAWAQRPFASVDALHAAMMAAVRATPRERQIAFLRGHPELAGKEAQAGTMTDHSTVEQAGAGLNALSRDEFVELRGLNKAYAERHGFPFIVAVLKNTKAQIFEALRQRTGNGTEAEREAALGQISLITRLRLGRLFGEG